MTTLGKWGANNLRAWRRHRGLSQRALGEAVGTTGPVISLLENGERRISYGWLQKFAPVLGTTPGMLLDLRPDTIEAALVRVALDVPPERRADAMAHLQRLARPVIAKG